MAPPISKDEDTILPRRRTVDLLPNVAGRFDAKKTFKKGVDAVMAARKLKSIDGSMSSSMAISSSASSTSASTANITNDISVIDLDSLRPKDEGGNDGSLMVLEKKSN